MQIITKRARLPCAGLDVISAPLRREAGARPPMINLRLRELEMAKEILKRSSESSPLTQRHDSEEA